MAKKTLEQKRDAEIAEINSGADKDIQEVTQFYLKKITRRDKKAAKAAFTDAND